MEVYLLFSWIADAPLVAILYLICATLAGVFCIFWAKAAMREIFARLRDIERGGLGALLVFGKLWLIGALLLFPGYLTDMLALYLALFRRAPGGKGGGGGGGDERVLEVRGRIVKDE